MSQSVSFTIGRRNLQKLTERFWELRRRGYGEAEALDELQVKEVSERMTIATQTNISAKVRAAGRPMTLDVGRAKGKMSMTGQTEYPDPLRFPPTNKDIQEAPDQGPIEFESFEGIILNEPKGGEKTLEYLEQVHDIAEDISNTTSGVPEGRFRSSNAFRRSLLTEDPTLTPEQTTAKVRRVIRPLTLGSGIWNAINWEIGAGEWDTAEFVGRISRPISETELGAPLHELELYIPIVGMVNVKVVINTVENEEITGKILWQEISNFVTSSLPKDIIATILTNRSLAVDAPIVLAIIKVLQAQGTDPSIFDLRANAGLSMKVENFRRTTEGWMLMFHGEQYPSPPEKFPNLEGGRIEVIDDVTFRVGIHTIRLDSKPFVFTTDVIRQNLNFLTDQKMGSFFIMPGLEYFDGNETPRPGFALSNNSIVIASGDMKVE